MNAIDTPTNWTEANQRHLTASVEVVRAMLAAYAGRANGSTVSGNATELARVGLREAEDAARAAAESMPAPAAIDSLVSAFGLSPFERDVLLLCAAVELEGGFAARCAEAQGDPHLPYPTFGLALAALPDPHWSALVPGAPLRWWHLVAVTSGDGLTTGRLRIDERVLHYLTGLMHLDERLQGLVVPVLEPDELTTSHADLARRIAAIWSRTHEAQDLPLVQLWGEDRADAIAIAVHACDLLGIQLHRLRASDVPASVADRELLGRLWQREAVLSSSALLIDINEVDGPDAESSLRAATSLADRLRGLVVLAAREPASTVPRGSVQLHVARHNSEERRAIWTSMLGSASTTMNGHLDTLVAQFNLGVRGIRAASADAFARLAANERPHGGLAEALWDSCRSQATTRLDELAQRIDASSSWDDLVLPKQQGRLLLEIVLHVRNRTKVYETWGFARKGRRGLGISALFAGPSGTGKTMAAEVLANELSLDLYRIDLSQVVSKYIGETEKNLRRVFDAAEEGGSILLFDEADALFGKRSEVKDSHDRYANIEVSYLLQRMETYRGLAILTTNLKSALDSAFLRRLRFIVQFPFPDAASRAEIWRRIFPVETPTDGLDMAKLARLTVAGGTIRSIALSAAFLAADAGEQVRMPHVLQAARSEYGKLEKPVTDAEVAGWTT